MSDGVIISRMFALRATAEGGVARYVFSLLLGTVFTCGLFVGIARYEKAPAAVSSPELKDLPMAILSASPPTPPPTPRVPPPQAAEALPLLGFELAPSTSVVKFEISPPAWREILPEELSKAPPPRAVIGFSPSDFKPTVNAVSDPEHVFQHREVDQVPTVLYRAIDNISRCNLATGIDSLRLVCLVTVNVDGSVGNVRLQQASGNAKFDEFVMIDLRNWVFTPAVKSGKKVRCLVLQSISLATAERSPFSL